MKSMIELRALRLLNFQRSVSTILMTQLRWDPIQTLITNNGILYLTVLVLGVVISRKTF